MGYWEGLEPPPNAGQVSHPNGGETNMVVSWTVGGETSSLTTAGAILSPKLLKLSVPRHVDT